MHSKIFLLSTVALLGISVVAYGKLYINGHASDGTIPRGDCLEMICQYGCVENDSNNYEGSCCPNDGRNGNSCTMNECCSSGSCINGKCGCEKDEDCEGELICKPDKTCGCPEGSTLYTKTDDTSGCCNDQMDNATHVLAVITGDTVHKACCPKSTPIWDTTQQKCVECLTDEDCEGEEYCDTTTKTCIRECVPLYTNKQYNKEVNGSPCCDNLITSTVNVLFSGWNKADETKYGCCPQDRTFEQTCCKTTQKALTTGCCDINKIYTEAEEQKCCPANTNLPKYNESCNAICGCYLDSGLTCNTTNSTCTCPENYGWDSVNNKCLPYCTEDMGIFLLVDRSGSTFNHGSDHYCDSDKDACKKINRFLQGLDLSDRNYALYNEETKGCGYNQAMSMLPFGQHSTNDYALWNDVQYKVKCSSSDTTQFDEALAHVKSNYCKKDNPIVIAIITDGKIQEDKSDMSSSMNYMIGRCDARIVYIGPDGSTLEKYMDKHVTNFESYDFDDNVQSWIRGTNNAINGSCIPTNKGKKNPSQSDRSWFCNVLKNANDGDSYLRLTEDQCFSCGNKTKFRWSGDRKKWGSAGVCCGQDNNKGSCKDSDYTWWDKNGNYWGK